MTCCNARCCLITITFLQLTFTIFRQVFDFLGFVWIPIACNFVNLLLVLVGLIGALQYRYRIIITYSVWCLLWIALNAYVICYYLEIGSLNREMGHIVKWSQYNETWWQKHEILCQSSLVHKCYLKYYQIEIIQAAIQCGLSFIGFCLATYVACIYLEDDDSSQPVLDELEYIKMRYRSVAKNSFRTTGRKSGTVAKRPPVVEVRTNRRGIGPQSETLRTNLECSFVQSSPLLSSCQGSP